MSIGIAPPVAADHFAVPPEPVLPLTVSQYHAMIRAGILESGAPIELLEGWLVTKMAKNPPHSASTAKVRRRLVAVLPQGWSVDTQEPITTSDSEPEPDLSVIRGSREDFVDRHPGPAEVGLVVEVADTSIHRDRGWKKRIYAAAGIATYWIVNLNDRSLEVFSNPSGPGERPDYEIRRTFLPNEEVPVVLDGNEVGRMAVEELLP